MAQIASGVPASELAGDTLRLRVLPATLVCTPSSGQRAAAPPSGNSVFLVDDDECGLHHDYKKWLEALAPHAPISQYEHNRTGEACPEACPKEQRRRPPEAGSQKRLHSADHGPRRAAVVAVTNGRLDFGTWERIPYEESAATVGSAGSGCK